MEIRQWRPETAGLSMTTSLSALRPTTKGPFSKGISLITAASNFRSSFGIAFSPSAPEQARHQPLHAGLLARGHARDDDRHVVDASGRAGFGDQGVHDR